jgi:hypothetical protein
MAESRAQARGGKVSEGGLAMAHWVMPPYILLAIMDLLCRKQIGWRFLIALYLAADFTLGAAVAWWIHAVVTYWSWTNGGAA